MAVGLLYEEMTEKIIGCAMTVHREMGAGYNELMYSRCLEIEFKKIGIYCQTKMELPIYYDEFIVGKRSVDFVVQEKIVVELKAIADLTDKELNQALTYLQNHKKEVGLLINFGAKSLQFRRSIHQKKPAAINNPANP